MKLNVTFVPFDKDCELKIVAYGEKDAVLETAKALQNNAFCTNVYMTEEKEKVNN